LFSLKTVTAVFLLQVLPVVVFFYTVTSVLYYLGVMQVVVKRMGMFLAFCLGTTPAESLNAAGNIFVGMVYIIGIAKTYTLYSVIFLNHMYRV
jgi:nucleoside permease NupC